MKRHAFKEFCGSFSCASVYVGALVGPALVAGTYATVFYLPSGCNSLWLPFVACALVGLMCVSAAEIIRHYKTYEYGALAEKVYFGKKFFCVLFDVYVMLSNLVGTSLILSMSGSFLTELTGLPNIVGMIIIAVLTVVLVKYRDKIIRFANSIMTIVLIVGFAVISLLVLGLYGDRVYAVLSSWQAPEGTSIWQGFGSACKYAFASSAFAMTMCCVEQPIKTHRQSLMLGGCILVMGGLLQAISCFTFLPFVSEVMGDSMPLVYVMNNYIAGTYPWIPTVYYILMLLAIISSTIPATYMISSRYQHLVPNIPGAKTEDGKNMTAASGFMLVCTLVGALGLSTLANQGLTVVSWIGMPIVVIPLLFIWPRIMKKIRREEKKDETTVPLTTVNSPADA